MKAFCQFLIGITIIGFMFGPIGIVLMLVGCVLMVAFSPNKSDKKDKDQ